MTQSQGQGVGQNVPAGGQDPSKRPGNQPKPGEPGYDPKLDPNSPEYDPNADPNQGDEERTRR